MSAHRLLAASAPALTAALTVALSVALTPLAAPAQVPDGPSVVIGGIRVGCDQLGFGLRQRLPECVVERPRGLLPQRPTVSPASAPVTDDTRLADEAGPVTPAPPAPIPRPASGDPVPQDPMPAEPVSPTSELAETPVDDTVEALPETASVTDAAADPVAASAAEPPAAAEAEAPGLPAPADLPVPEMAADADTALPPLRPDERPLARPPQSVFVAADGLDEIALASETGSIASIFADPAEPGDLEEPDVRADASVGQVPVPASPPGEGEAIGTMADLRGYVIRFEPGQSELSAAAESLLLGLSERLRADEDAMVQVRAFATSGPADGSGGSRVMSLYRALAVRNALLNMGVRATAIDIRALGDAVEDEPHERVDIELGSR